MSTATTRLALIRSEATAVWAAVVALGCGVLGAASRWSEAVASGAFGAARTVDAAGLVVGSTAVLLLRRRAPAAAHAFGLVLAGALGALAVSSLFEEVISLAGSRASLERDPVAVVLAGSFTLVAVALLIARRRERGAARSRETLAVVAFCVGLALLLARAFGAVSGTTWAALGSIAVPTTVGVAALALAAFFVGERLELARRFTEDSAGGLALRRLVPAAIAVPTLIGLVVLAAARWLEASLAAATAVYAVTVAMLFAGVVLRTDRAMRRLAARRADAEKRFRRTFENATVGMAHVAPDGRWLRFNDRICELAGRTRQELHEAGFEDLLHPECLGSHLEQKSRLLRGETGSFRLELRIVRPDGRETWAEERAFAQRSDGGELEYVIYVLLDLSERIEAQRERERLLAEAVAARSEAERANQAKDEFLALLSHELRTPLNAMTSWLSILRSDPNDVTRRRALEVLDGAVRSQTRLIGDLLDVSRIRTGALELELEPIDLRWAVESAVVALQPLAESAGVRLVGEMATTPVPIRGDEERLRQVVRNLVDNALGFTLPGGEVRVRVEVEDTSAVVEVLDDGPGLEPELMPRLFERFQQGQRRSTQPGLGLGLAIVRHVVEGHGGEVWATNRETGGACFGLRLPLVEADELSQRTPSGRLVLEDETLDLLIVDDDRAALEGLRLLIEKDGVVVRTATTVEGALAAVEERRPTVLLSDVYMPGASGLDLVRELRRQEAEGARRVTAVAMSAVAGQRDRARILESGFDEFVAKPIDPELLLELLGLQARTKARGVLRLLVVDDDRASLAAIETLLDDSSTSVRVAETAAEALELARELSPQIVVVDYLLPDATGAELVRRLRQQCGVEIPAVALSGLAGEELERERELFAEVLRKPVEIERLEQVIETLRG